MKIAEWELLTEITGVDMSPLANMFGGWATTLGGNPGGGDGGGDDVATGDGGIANPDPGDAPPDDSYIPPLQFDSGDLSSGCDPSASFSPETMDTGAPSTYDMYPGDAPPAYPYSPSVYSVELNPYTMEAQQTADDAAILESQQFEADQAQQVIAAGYDNCRTYV